MVLIVNLKSQNLDRAIKFLQLIQTPINRITKRQIFEKWKNNTDFSVQSSIIENPSRVQIENDHNPNIMVKLML